MRQTFKHFSQLNTLLTFAKASLSQRIAKWVLISILLIEVIIVFPSYLVRKDELLSQLEELALTVMLPIIHLTELNANHIDRLSLTSELLADTLIIGQVIYDLKGEEVERAGESPTIAPGELATDEVVRRLSEDGLRYDIAWSATYLNTDYHCMVRLDASQVQAEMWAYTQRMVGFILLISAFVTIATMLSVGKTVIIPILQLRDRLLAMAQGEVVSDLNLLSIEHHDELADVMLAFNTMSGIIQERTMRMEAELNVARQLQAMLSPTKEELQEIEGLDISCYMEPADEVGGDYLDVLKHNGHVKIGIGDVTGHGLESGVLMLMTQTAVRTLLTSDERDPTRFLNTLNRTIYDNVQRMKANKSLTLALLDYSYMPNHVGQIRLSGQHEEVIVIRQGGEIELIDTMDLGFPIGLDDDISDFISEQAIQLDAGDGIVLYTDGITEAENLAGEQYGLERLCEVSRRHWQERAEGIQEAIIKDVRSFIGEQKVYDDLTLLVLKQK
jgi:serine phosphatase RsbU (regulator of sigma subunit)